MRNSTIWPGVGKGGGAGGLSRSKLSSGSAIANVFIMGLDFVMRIIFDY